MLVIEDDALVARDLQLTLEDLGYRTQGPLATAEAALAAVDEHAPDVALVDIRLEGAMDGIELAEHLWDRMVPVVFLTAYADEETLARAKRTRPYSYLNKPVEPVDLRTAIEVAAYRGGTEARLERANEQLASFAHAAAHDLRAPLRHVVGHLDLLARRHGDALDEAAREHLEAASQAASRMQAMIEGVLRYAKAGAQAPEAPVEADRALQMALTELEPLIEASGAQVTHDPLPPVLIDPTALARVFQNLVEDAIVHRGTGSPRIHVGTEDRGTGVHLTVTDDGPGIPAEEQAGIFDLFSAGGGEGSGTGVGLASCKRIVELAGGEIWVESEVGQGSTFHFTVPGLGQGERYLEEEHERWIPPEPGLEEREAAEGRARRTGEA